MAGRGTAICIAADLTCLHAYTNVYVEHTNVIGYDREPAPEEGRHAHADGRVFRIAKTLTCCLGCVASRRGS